MRIFFAKLKTLVRGALLLFGDVRALRESLISNSQEQLIRTKYMHQLMVEDYLTKLFDQPRFRESKRIVSFDRQVYSQNGEDGIIAEIFNRIGTTNRFFIEIGVEDGTECNTTYLLLKGWRGLWLEGNAQHVLSIQKHFVQMIENGRLMVKCAFVQTSNINELMEDLNAPASFDLLSIDIDYNDYHIWKAIERFNPRVVVVEYNGMIPADIEFIVEYDGVKSWDGTKHFGASLKSLEKLGAEKGYDLVGCGVIGLNAFFVRSDLTGNLFCNPFTSENHFEPARFYLYRSLGHPRGFGNLATVYK